MWLNLLKSSSGQNFTKFEERFSQADLTTLHELEMVLLTGQVTDIVESYPELEVDVLRVQLQMFLLKHKVKSSGDATSILGDILIEVRGLYNQVETLVRLLLVVQVSSTEAERSFSALMRLKTWLRFTMSQERLNHAAVCHVHKAKMDEIDLNAICKQIVLVCEGRRHVFGSFT